MRRVLITGGAGFIGSNFVRHLLAMRREVRVVTLDALTYAGLRENLPGADHPRHTFVEGDIRDGALVSDLLRGHRIDTIVHFAAESHVDRSLYDPGLFLSVNVQGTATLLEAARAVWTRHASALLTPPRFHHVSTDEVYGDLAPSAPPSREGDPYHPSSPYAASKAGADHLIWAWRRSFDLPVSLHHSANTYGPRQFPEKLLPLFIQRALAGESLPVYGDGQQRRDWLYVDDHCAALLKILLGPEGVAWHVAAEQRVTNLALIHHLCAELDRLHPQTGGGRYADLITHVPDRAGHDRRYALDSSHLRRNLRWQPAVGWQEGVTRTVRWYLEHPAWLEAVRASPRYRAWIARQYAEP